MICVCCCLSWWQKTWMSGFPLAITLHYFIVMFHLQDKVNQFSMKIQAWKYPCSSQRKSTRAANFTNKSYNNLIWIYIYIYLVTSQQRKIEISRFWYDSHDWFSCIILFYFFSLTKVDNVLQVSIVPYLPTTKEHIRNHNYWHPLLFNTTNYQT